MRRTSLRHREAFLLEAKKSATLLPQEVKKSPVRMSLASILRSESPRRLMMSEFQLRRLPLWGTNSWHPAWMSLLLHQSSWGSHRPEPLGTLRWEWIRWETNCCWAWN